MEKKKCPFCGEEIAATAKKCRFCGEWLEEVDIKSTTSSPAVSAAPQPAVVPPPVTPAQPAVPPTQPVPPAPAEPTPDVEPIIASTGDFPSFFKAYFVNPYIRRYADFKGYTSRKSFWLTYLATAILGAGFCGLVMLLCSMGMGGILAGSIVGGVIQLALVIPGLALCVRRLRDAGINPWQILLGLIPIVGPIIILIYLCKRSAYEDTEEPGKWQLPDWIVTAVCAALVVLGIVFCVKALHHTFGGDSAYNFESYDDGSFEVVDEEEYAYPVEEAEAVVEEDYTDSTGAPSLTDIAPARPNYFTFQLVPLRMGSDKKMVQLFNETGSTNVPIEGKGMIGNDNISMEGWITEDGTIHGRYHNENGTNLDFNGYIRQDDGLYIQLGHDNTKSEWILFPVVSENSYGKIRYEGKWGKSQKDSYVTFSEM